MPDLTNCLHAFPYFISETKPMCGFCPYVHFIEKETEAWRIK